MVSSACSGRAWFYRVPKQDGYIYSASNNTKRTLNQYILGKYPSGERLARDGKTIVDGDNEFGMEWQVLTEEPMLFHDIDEVVQHPESCAMPTEKEAKSIGRKLRALDVSEDAAAAACAHVAGDDLRDNCIFDVLATQDEDMAGSY